MTTIPLTNQVCCAHCKVVLKHNDHPGGTRSDYWECADGCGQVFAPLEKRYPITVHLTRVELDNIGQAVALAGALLLQQRAPAMDKMETWMKAARALQTMLVSPL